LHSLQGRSGTHREGLRLKRNVDAGVCALAATTGGVLLAVVGGCAGPLALDGSSASLGTAADGALRRPTELPLEGDGYLVPQRWRARHSNYGTEELVGAVVRASRAVDRKLPGGIAAIGDLSRRGGGASVEHKSHQNGRDVDVFFYAIDRERRAVRPGEAMVRFGADGQAVRWSPARGFGPPPVPVPEYRFDAARNWAFVRALLTDADAEVQWIFIQRALGALLIRAATEAGEDPAVVARAASILHEPTDAEPHDDHMHVRLYCDPADRACACAERGPIRWWKKMWKYMAPSFGRAADPSLAGGLREMTDVVRGELPVVLVGGVLTS
jgi:penicillin-insensitive murein DD-endopeptidase